MNRCLIISDTHFGDKGVLNFEGRRGKRFKTIEEHDEYLCRKWEDAAARLDKRGGTLYFLGDFGRPSKQIHERLASCKEDNPDTFFVWVRGNHDSDDIVLEYGPDCFHAIYDNPLWISHRVMLSHRPQIVWPGQLNVHGHTHSATLDDSRFLCASAAMVDFNFISEKQVASALGKMNKPDYRFLWEPWADMYKFDEYKTNVVKDKTGDIDLAASRAVQHLSNFI